MAHAGATTQVLCLPLALVILVVLALVILAVLALVIFVVLVGIRNNDAFNQAPCDGGLDFSRSRQQIFDVFTIIRQVVSVGSVYSKGNNGRIADIVFECLRGTIGPDTWRSGWNLEDELGSKAQTGNGPRSLLPPTKRWLCSMMAFICEVMQGTQTTGAAIATTVEGILEGIRGQVIGI